MQIDDINRTKDDNPPNEFPLSNSQIMNYKDTFQQLSLQKKKTYLQAIQSHNKELVKKIKDLDRRLNNQVDSLSKKIVPSRKKTVIPKIEELETAELREKFKEMEHLKHQLAIKKSGTDSLEFLLMVKQQHLITLRSLQREIGDLKPKIAILQKIKNKTEREEDTVRKEVLRVGELKMFGDEIGELRKKVQAKNEEIKLKKEKFISLYKKNRSNKSVIAEPSQHQEKGEETDPQLAALKQRYLQTGRKIDALKAKKANILKTTPDPKQLQKMVDKLKLKYQTLSKLTR